MAGEAESLRGAGAAVWGGTLVWRRFDPNSATDLGLDVDAAIAPNRFACPAFALFGKIPKPLGADAGWRTGTAVGIGAGRSADSYRLVAAHNFDARFGSRGPDSRSA